jgi:hypothetical protein
MSEPDRVPRTPEQIAAADRRLADSRDKLRRGEQNLAAAHLGLAKALRADGQPEAAKKAREATYRALRAARSLGRGQGVGR